MTNKELTTIEKLKSQIGDDLQYIFDHEALFKLAVRDLEALTAENKRLREALAECEEYFDDRADAEYFPDSAIPMTNREMDMLVVTRAALKGADYD